MSLYALYAGDAALITSQRHFVVEIGRIRNECNREGHYRFSDQTTLHGESTNKRKVVEARVRHPRDERFEDLRARQSDALFRVARERRIPGGYWSSRRNTLLSDVR